MTPNPKKQAPRYKVTADGVWTGGSYATKAEAERAARAVRQQRRDEGRDQEIKVEAKGAFIAEPEPAPAAPSSPAMPEPPSAPPADPPPPPPEDPPPPSKPTKSKK